MNLFRACDCYTIPCFHNPGKEHEEAKRKFVEFKNRVEAMPWWKRLFQQGSIGREQRILIAELEATDWRKKVKHYA